MLIFGDNPSGEIFYVNADTLPKGGQNFHRILFKRQGRDEDAAPAHQGEERAAGEDAGHARRPAHGHGAERSAVHPEQARRHHPAADAVAGRLNRQLANRVGGRWCDRLRLVPGLPLVPAPPDERCDRGDELSGIDRLCEVHFKAAAQRLRAVFRSRERRQGRGRQIPDIWIG